MPLSRLMGYYCLLMLLCSIIFARWLPTGAPASDTAAVLAQDSKPAGKNLPLFAFLRTDPGAALPGKS